MAKDYGSQKVVGQRGLAQKPKQTDVGQNRSLRDEPSGPRLRRVEKRSFGRASEGDSIRKPPMSKLDLSSDGIRGGNIDR